MPEIKPGSPGATPPSEIVGSASVAVPGNATATNGFVVSIVRSGAGKIADADPTLTADSDERVPTQKAVKAAIAAAAGSGHPNIVRGTAAELEADNPTLALDQIGLTLDTIEIRIGDGETAWNDLDPIKGGAQTYAELTSIPAALDAIDGLTPAAGKMARYTGPATADLIDVGASGAALLAAGTAATARTHLNVADGATANDSDAGLRDRATHTGTQVAATISDLDAAVADLVANKLTFDARTASAFASANPTLGANVLGIETDTGFMKRGAGAWNSLPYLPVHASALLGALEDINAAGGSNKEALASLLEAILDETGIQLDAATPTQFYNRTPGILAVTPESWGNSWQPVTLTPVAGEVAVPETFNLAVIPLVADTAVTALTSKDGQPRPVEVTASGGDRFLDWSVAGRLSGFHGQTGVLVRSGQTARFEVWKSGADQCVRYVGQSGDEGATVALEIVSGSPNTITIDGSRCIRIGKSAPISANVKLLSLKLDSRPRTVLIPVSAAASIIAHGSDWDLPLGFGAGSAVDVAANATAEFQVYLDGTAKVISYRRQADTTRLIPSFVSSAMSQSGAALTPAGTADGDYALVIDGRPSSALASAISGWGTEFTGLQTGVGSGVSTRFWGGFITAGATIPAASMAARRIVLVYRNVDPDFPILGTPLVSAAASGTAVTIPALTLPQLGLIVAGYLIDDITSAPDLAAALTARSTVGASDTPARAGDTNGAVTSFAGQTITIGTSEPWIGWAFGLRGKPAP